MVYLNYYTFWYPKIANPNNLSSYGSISNCSAIAMGNKNTFMCNKIKGTKTPIKYIFGIWHFKW